MFAVHDEDAALDIVQDSMLKLAEKYGDRPDAEYPMLFQRIRLNINVVNARINLPFPQTTTRTTPRSKRWPPMKMMPAREHRKASYNRPRRSI